MNIPDLKVVYLVTGPSSDKKFPSEPSASDLESILQDAFGAWEGKVIDGYFVEGSEYYPQNLAFLVAPYQQNGSQRIFMAALIALDDEIEGFKFIYYDKIGVAKLHQGNGLMPKMIRVARQVNYDGKNVKPSLLRTSKDKLNAVYAEESDIRTPNPINGFHIHGFGFADKKTQEELFEGAHDKFMNAAKYVASKPKTVIPIGSIYYKN